MRLPKLHESTMRKIDLFNSSFWAAVNNKGRNNNALGILERRRVHVWLRKAYEAVNKVLPETKTEIFPDQAEPR